MPAGLSNAVAIAAGSETSLSLKADGSIVSWGYGIGTYAFSNIVAITCSEYSALALKIDGTVVGSGNNQFGQTQVPPGLSGVVDVAIGGFHALALKTNGTVVAWGRNNFGQTNVPAGLSGVVQIACGKEHSLALKSDGTIVAWGNNTVGQSAIPLGLSGALSVACVGSNSFSVGANVSPQVESSSATCAMNLASVVWLAASDPNNDPLGRRVITVPARGSLFQYGAGGPGEVLASNSLVSDPLGRVIFVPATNEFGWPYSSFTFAADDGLAVSTMANVLLNVIPAPALISDQLSATGNGAFSCSFTGHSNAVYRVWVSSNLVSWNALGYGSQSPPGSFFYVDAGATNWPVSFYRVSSP